MVKHPSLTGYTVGNLSNFTNDTADISVFDNLGFEDGDHIVIGTIGRATAESAVIDDTVVRGQSLTLSAPPVFTHNTSEAVTVCPEAQIRIFAGPTTNFSDASAITTVPIQFAKEFTTYYIPAPSVDNYYFVKFADADASTLSEESIPIAATGYDIRTAAKIIDNALGSSNSAINDLITYDFLLTAVNEAQQRITQLTTADTSKKNWSFEIAENYIDLIQDQRSYSLSSLTSPLKYPTSVNPFIEVIVDTAPLRPRTLIELELEITNRSFTTLTAEAAIGDISISVANTAEFPENGTLNIRGQQISYTGKTITTFTGIPATGDGSITAIIPSGAEAWQPSSSSTPTSYAVSQNSIIFDLPIDNKTAGKRAYIRYYSALNQISELGQLVAPQFTNLVKDYVVSKIEYAKGAKADGVTLGKDFEEKIAGVMLQDTIETSKTMNYYRFNDTDFKESTVNQTNF
jgi:hypothetical protein